MTIRLMRRPEIDRSAPSPSAEVVEVREQEFDEIEVMRRLASGDTAALQQIMEIFWNPLGAYASRLLDDMDEAKDVTQTVFMRLWNGRADWKPGSLRSYLFRLTRNVALDVIRAEKARTLRQQTHGPRPVPRTPSDVFEYDELTARVDRAIQALPSRRREVFTLAYLHGLSYRQIAEIMQISDNTVSNHMSKALGSLREALVEADIPPREGIGGRGERSE